MKNIDLIILCGGKGTRLRSIIKNKPKILCEIQNRPFIEILLEKVTQFNFDNIVLSSGYHGNQIKHWIEKSKYSDDVSILIEKRPLGTGGAVKFASPENANDKMVINGDTIFDIDFELYYKRIKGYCDVGVGVKHVKISDFKETGYITLNQNNEITQFNEKGADFKNSEYAYINIGFYYFNKDIIKIFPNYVPLSLEHDVFPLLISKKTHNKGI